MLIKSVFVEEGNKLKEFTNKKFFLKKKKKKKKGVWVEKWARTYILSN
jgi:hypothetical protein